MIREGLEYLSGVLRKGHGSELVTKRNDIDHYIVDGKLESIENDKPARCHHASNIDSLTAYETNDSVIWHAGNDVTLVIVDSQSNSPDFVSWKLQESSKSLAFNVSHVPMEHKDFIKFLLMEWRDEIERDAPGVLGTLRHLKFHGSTESDSDISHGKESMGKNIKNSVQGTTDLPETIVLTVRRWADLDIVVEVESMLIVDPEEMTLCIKPLSDSIVNANLDAHRQLNERLLAHVECPVYHGRFKK